MWNSNPEALKMDDVADRSNTPPPLPPKTRKSNNISSITGNNQDLATEVTPASRKITVFGVVTPEGNSVLPPTESSDSDALRFSFPEVRSLNLLSEQTTVHTPTASLHCITNGNQHVVKIRISPGDDAIASRSATQHPANLQQHQSLCGKTPVSSVSKADAQSHDFHPSHYTTTPAEGCIRINVGSCDVEHPQQHEEMVRRSTTSISGNFTKTSPPERANQYFLFGTYSSSGMVISSGQSSPSDTLDSGTCSDLDGSTPPPLPKKKSVSNSTSKVTVTVNGGGHRRTGSLTSSGAEVDSDDDGSNISCDSLNSSELNGESTVLGEARQDIKQIHEVNKVKSEETGAEMETRLKSPTPTKSRRSTIPSVEHPLPQGLLQDIRDRTAKLAVVPSPCGTLTGKTRTWAHELSPKPKKQNKLRNGKDASIILNGSLFKSPDVSPTSTLSKSSDDQRRRSIVEERTYEERRKVTTEKQNASSSNVIKNSQKFDTDRFYKFHLNEHVSDGKDTNHGEDVENEETFAGYRDLLQGKDSSSTIKSAKGTIRGVKNRVRAGIATFLQLHDTKNYKKEEAGKIVVYTTTMGIVRQTYQDCVLVKKILRNLMVKYEERDIFMSRETQAEIRERLGTDVIIVPQIFVEGQHIGNAETFEKLNESGELRRILKPFKSPDTLSTCNVCGGHRLLPCSICKGSKKSVHRNEFTAEFVALKCMQCDEVGLVRCQAC